MAEHGDPGERTGLEVAVVGMAGRFPGADDLHAFWRNLREGVESIAFYTREELLEAGADPALLGHPHFVPAKGELRGADRFDAALFGLTPRDAEILDPQHRVLLECAWAALEHAGYDPARAEGPVGVFAGSGTSTYVLNLAADPELAGSVGMMRLMLWNEKDHLATGISYRLNLRGPSVAVQTACSTSLVAVHLACQSLINGECDLALAGGVTVSSTVRNGYLYAPDGILSPDGHCRAFDADARGAVGGNGAGMVALRRLESALADGDTIHAVIRGSAINNDGAQKMGYTAPSVTGQARVLAEALSVAGVDPATVQYVETHGSGTPLGDAIELKAMSQVLARAGGGHRCAIGSVKTNLGHLDTAAGVAGLIKTVLALEHGEIPPSLNCAVPHPEIEASGSRVFVNTALRPWERNGGPRRAGVSSFGIGGTNAHVVLEEAPPPEPSGPSRDLQLLVVSARTATALAAAAERLAGFLEREAPPLADAAYTLQTGRRELEHRLAVVCRDAREGAARLREAAARAALPVPRTDRPVAFMFPGLGMHHVDMGRGLYDVEPVFRAAVDECCALLFPVLGGDLREALFSAAGPQEDGGGGWDLRRLVGRDGGEGGGSPLDEARLAQPAVFVVEYALARLWTSWGVRPRAVVGHSLGEYVAACVAGVLRLEDALKLVALRARLVDALPGGAMLAVPLGEAALLEILPAGLDVAAVNTRESCVVAGPAAEIEAFEAGLAGRGVVSRRLATRQAFHSRAMAAVAAELERLVAGFDLRPPEIPLVSNVTGTWISDEDARSPAYWARHLRETVRFADGVATLREEPGWVLLEVGPGQALGAWAMQHPMGGAPEAGAVLSSLRHQHNRMGDLHFLLETLGGLWTAGVAVDWAAFSRGERRRRIPLPGYPFERKRYWVEPPRRRAARQEPAGGGPGAAEAPGAAAPAPAPVPALAGSRPAALERVIAQQLELMSRQLAALRGASRRAAAPAPAPPAQAVAPAEPDSPAAAAAPPESAEPDVQVVPQGNGQRQLRTESPPESAQPGVQAVPQSDGQRQLRIESPPESAQPDVEVVPLTDGQERLRTGSPPESARPGIQVVPLTDGQRQLWLESQMGDDASRAYIESSTVRLRGPLDPDALRRALQGLVDRYDVLRATFSRDGEAQLIHPTLPVEVPLVDFRGVPPGEREARVEEWVRRATRRPFDLVEGPLVRFALAAVDAGEHLLLLDSHHAVLDGWSFGVVWQELGALYAAAREGREARLPPRPRYAELVAAQVAAVREDPAAEAFWLAEFADGVPVLDLPTDRPRPPVRIYRGERIRRVLGGGLVERLDQVGRRHGLTLFNTFLSAFFVWLARLSGQEDIVVGVPAAGQAGRGEARELVGYGINVLPIRARVEPSLPFVEHARRVRRAVLRALEHQDFSLPRLVEKLLRARDPGRPPLFSVMMNLDRARGTAALGDLSAEFENNFGGGAKLDLNLDLTETEDGLRVECDYATALFDRDTIERWLASFERLLAEVAERPDQPVGEVEMLPDPDLSRIVDEFCDATLDG